VSPAGSIDNELPVTSPSETRPGDVVAGKFSVALVDGPGVAGAVGNDGSPAFPASNIIAAIRFKVHPMNKCYVALLRPYTRNR
jgi:hypothetical protein